MIAEMRRQLVGLIGVKIASMGPRSNDRGNVVARSRTLQGRGLQWGRDQMIAEMTYWTGAPPGSALLQWGRDQMIAEMPSVNVSPMSFRKMLQWGRDQMIAEIT